MCAQIILFAWQCPSLWCTGMPFRCYLESVARGQVSQAQLLLACISDTLGQIMLGIGCLLLFWLGNQMASGKILPHPFRGEYNSQCCGWYEFLEFLMFPLRCNWRYFLAEQWMMSG